MQVIEWLDEELRIRALDVRPAASQRWERRARVRERIGTPILFVARIRSMK
jgi:hypothetical protein